MPAVWGQGYQVLWPEGEPLLIVGRAGLGKTSLAQQLALSRHGIGEPVLLDLPVSVGSGRVLYVAADRPAQARRSLRRMVTEADRSGLEHLVAWPGMERIDATLLRLYEVIVADVALTNAQLHNGRRMIRALHEADGEPADQE